MTSGPSERYDFFLSRRGSVARITQEVADVLTEKGYSILTQRLRHPAILMKEKPAAVTQASVGRVAVQDMGGVGKTSLAVGSRRLISPKPPETSTWFSPEPSQPARISRRARE